MKSWKLDEPHVLRLETNEPSTLNEINNVKVKIEEVLFSTSDYQVYNGSCKRKYPIVLGRNAVGVVSEVFEGTSSVLNKMDRVVIEPFITCEKCDDCRNGDHSKCTNIVELGRNADGLLSNFVDLPLQVLHIIPDELSNEKALFTPYVAFCLNVVDELDVEKGQHVVVFSNTKAGLILAQVIAYYQAVPIFVSSNDELLESAREYGVFYCFNVEKTDVAKEIQTVTGGRMCKKLVFFADSDLPLKDALNSMAVNATLCMAGYSSRESKISVAQLCQKNLRVMCVLNGIGNYSSALNLLVTGTVKVDELMGEVIDFNELDTALASCDEKELELRSKIIKID